MNFDQESFSSNENDWYINAGCSKDFARKLAKKLEERLKEHEVNERRTRKERHVIFSQCFEEIIRNDGCFGPLLSEIKVEYENCIGAVLRGEKNADFLFRNITTCTSGLGTIKNYKDQIADLERKFRMLLEQNARLRQRSHFEVRPAKQGSNKVSKHADIANWIHVLMSMMCI